MEVNSEGKPLFVIRKKQTKGGVNLSVQLRPMCTPQRNLLLMHLFMHTAHRFLPLKIHLLLQQAAPATPTRICTSSDSSVTFPSNCPADAFRHRTITLILVLPADFVCTTMATLLSDWSWMETC